MATLQLNNYEKAFLIQILNDEKRRCDEWLENNEHDFSAYFVRNETLPFLERMIEKLEG